MADERPTTWAGAREAVAAAASASSTETPAGTEIAVSPPAESSPANVSTTPAPADPSAAATTAPPTAQQGTPAEPPKERWDTILENARRKEAERVRGEYSWIPQHVTPDIGRQIIDRAIRMAQDPIAQLTADLAELQQHPTYGPQLKSLAARTLANGRQAGAASGPPAPDIDVMGDGSLMLRSPQNEAQLLEFVVGQALGKVDERLKPVTEDLQTRQQREAAEAAARKADAFAKDLVGSLQQRPHFTEHRPAILERFNAIGAAEFGGTIPDERVEAVLQRAYIDVVTAKVLPTLTATAQRDAYANLNARAQGTTHNPSSPAPQATGRPTLARGPMDAWKQARAANGLT